MSGEEWKMLFFLFIYLFIYLLLLLFVEKSGKNVVSLLNLTPTGTMYTLIFIIKYNKMNMR